MAPALIISFEVIAIVSVCLFRSEKPVETRQTGPARA